MAWLVLRRGASLASALLLLTLVLFSGLSVVYLTHRDRVLFNELQVLRDQANKLDIQWGQLLIEQSTLGVGGRVEQRATELLGMQIPEVEKIVMVENEPRQSEKKDRRCLASVSGVLHPDSVRGLLSAGKSATSILWSEIFSRVRVMPEQYGQSLLSRTEGL